jgi:outer membrane protein
VEWDVQLALTVPLYAGGGTSARVREAVSQKTQADLDTSRVQRLAEQEIRSFYQTTLLDRKQLRALETATDAAKKNYEAQQRDYRYGLVTNLDVLQALTSYQENVRALDRAHYSAKLNWLRLQAATALRPAPDKGTTP